jgi:hypothetical protein
MVQLVLVKLRHDNKTIRTYTTLKDGQYNMVIFDGRKFNEKRYSLDGKFCLLLEDYLDDSFVFSRTIRRVVYDDESREIFKSQKILDKVNIPNEIFDKMLKDESVTLEKIDKTDIIDGSYWKFQESVILRAIPSKYYLLVEYKDETGGDSYSKLHYHYGKKVEMEDGGRNITIELDYACIKNMLVDGNIKEEVEVLTSTILENNNFLI